MADTELERMVVRLIGDAESYKRMVAEAKKANKDLQKGITEVETTFQKFNRSVKYVTDGLSNYGMRLKSFASGMRGVGKVLSIALTAPIMGVGAMATRELTEYDAALSRMKGLVGLSSEEIAGFSEEIKKLSVETGKAPIELAKAMENITSSGIKGAAASETLNISAHAAAGGLGEVRSVSDTVTSAMNAYGVANLSATRATDVLVAAVREGKAEAETFAPVLGQVLPVAQEMGVTFDEAAGFIAAYSLTTGSASQSAMLLMNVLSKMITLSPTSEIGKKLEGIGISVKKLKATIKNEGLLPAITDLRKQIESKGMGIEDFFHDQQALAGILQATGVNAEKMKSVLANVKNADGSVKGAFDAAASTQAFKYAQAMAQMKIIMLEIGEIFTDVTAQLMEWGMSGVEIWKSMSKETKKYIAYVLAVVALIGPLTVGLATGLTIIGTIMSGLGVTISVLVSGFMLYYGTVARTIFTLFRFWASIKVGTELAKEFKKSWSEAIKFVGESITAAGNAVKKGDLELAFKIVQKTIQVGWVEFTDFLLNTMKAVLNKILSHYKTAVSATSSILVQIPGVKSILGVKPEDDKVFQEQLANIQNSQFKPMQLGSSPELKKLKDELTKLKDEANKVAEETKPLMGGGGQDTGAAKPPPGLQEYNDELDKLQEKANIKVSFSAVKSGSAEDLAAWLNHKLGVNGKGEKQVTLYETKQAQRKKEREESAAFARQTREMQKFSDGSAVNNLWNKLGKPMSKVDQFKADKSLLDSVLAADPFSSKDNAITRFGLQEGIAPDDVEGQSRLNRMRVIAEQETAVEQANRPKSPGELEGLRLIAIAEAQLVATQELKRIQEAQLAKQGNITQLSLTNANF